MPLRRARRRRGASSSPDLGIPKGPTRAAKKAQADAAESVHIQHVHGQVWRRSPRVCELCGEDEWVGFNRGDAKWTHEMHEDPSRKKTMGLPLEQRFSLNICCRACPRCHRRQTSHEERLEFHDPVQRFQGDYDVLDRAGNVLRTIRRQGRNFIVASGVWVG